MQKNRQANKKKAPSKNPVADYNNLMNDYKPPFFPAGSSKSEAHLPTEQKSLHKKNEDSVKQWDVIKGRLKQETQSNSGSSTSSLDRGQ